ncbi:MAG: elongation factor G [Gammaproteobacteria bacterium]|jgi:elongation factor G|nr:elongation factor G [Gammaproteobacteria bacterium]
MDAYNTHDMRNIAFVGHAGSGKTTLVESLLHAAGAIPSAGAVERGNTVSDFDPMERELQHSLDTSLCHLTHDGRRINLIDTPGYPDFAGRAISVLPAVETAALVVNAQSGIEMVTESLMEAATQRELCRMIVVNRIDAPDTDLPALLHHIQDKFGSSCLPINLPLLDGSGVADCYFAPSGVETAFSSVESAHTRLIDQVVEVDEALMEVYLEQGQELDPAQLHEPFEQALREGHLIPVCFVSAQTGVGIPQLLDIFARLMPDPTEGNPPPFLKGEGATATPMAVVPDKDRHVVAHVFKVMVDPFVGRMGFFRIHQGTVTPDSRLFIGDGRKPFKVTHLLEPQGNDSRECRIGIPGDIRAVTKVDEIHFDAVLHDSHDEDLLHLISMNCPPAMFSLAVEAISRGDEQKLSEALAKLDAEDPCLHVEHRASLNETVLMGMGDLHLRIVLERMKAKFNVEVKTHPPSIAYRETITIPAEGHHRHKKQTGGAGQFGEVFLRVTPLERGSDFEFADKVVGGAIPGQFIPAVEKGVRQVIESGAIAGFPMRDIRVEVYDGKHHSVDSKEIAFSTAGRKAFLDAVSKAKPIVLEPIVKLRVTAPNQAMGDITGDLSGIRGMISGTEALPGNRVEITARVPLSELENYQSRLKSMTGGEGAYTVEFSHYDPVPPRTQQALVKDFKPLEEG